MLILLDMMLKLSQLMRQENRIEDSSQRRQPQRMHQDYAAEQSALPPVALGSSSFLRTNVYIKKIRHVKCFIDCCWNDGAILQKRQNGVT